MKVPSDVEAEWGALAGVIIGNATGAGRLTLDLFTDEEAGKVAEWVASMLANRQLITAEVAIHRLGGPTCARLSGSSGPGLEYFLPILREKRALREAQLVAFELNRTVQTLEAENRPIAADVRAAIGATCGRLSGIGLALEDGSRVSMRDAVSELIDALQDSDNGKTPPRVPTGIVGLDSALGGGLRATEIAVIGALTGSGKSALACWFTKAACSAGKSVLYVSREMKRVALMERLISAESGVPVQVHDGTKRMNDQQRRSVVSAAARVKNWSLNIRDDIRSVHDIRAEVEATKPDLFVVDHIGAFDSGLGPKASQYERATAASNAIRDIAYDTGCAGLVLCQINREGAALESPSLRHLKGSGAIEEDARAVMLLHREQDQDDGTHSMTLNLAKLTSRPSRILNLRYHPAICSFFEERERPDHSAK